MQYPFTRITMKQTITSIMICCMLTSCATIINQRTTYMTVRTSKPSLIILENDSIKTRRNKVTLSLERSKEPLILTTICDSTKSQMVIKARNSFAYYLNIGYNLGIGMWLERNNPKRYSYPMSIKINPSNASVKVYKNYEPPEKGNLLLHVSLPYINSFYLQTDHEGKKIHTGFWGLSLGLDYYHNDHQYFSVSASAVTDFFVPVPAAVDIRGSFERMSSTYACFSNHHKLNRFSFGYGISYGINSWSFDYIGPTDSISPPRLSASESFKAIGLIFPVYYQTGRSFHLGVIYRPTLVRLNSRRPFAYEHIISIDIAWKIRLKK